MLKTFKSDHTTPLISQTHMHRDIPCMSINSPSTLWKKQNACTWFTRCLILWSSPNSPVPSHTIALGSFQFSDTGFLSMSQMPHIPSWHGVCDMQPPLPGMFFLPLFLSYLVLLSRSHLKCHFSPGSIPDFSTRSYFLISKFLLFIAIITVATLHLFEWLLICLYLPPVHKLHKESRFAHSWPTVLGSTGHSINICWKNIRFWPSGNGCLISTEFLHNYIC